VDEHQSLSVPGRNNIAMTPAVGMMRDRIQVGEKKIGGKRSALARYVY
jgi:hypothetical protein